MTTDKSRADALTDLLPCPFCGAKATTSERGKGASWYPIIACVNWCCSVSGAGGTRDGMRANAVKTWNTRAAIAASPVEQPAAAPCKCRRLGDWNGAHHPLCDSSAPAPAPAPADERAACIAWANANGFTKYHESMCAAWEERARRTHSASETGAEGAPIVQAGRDVLVTHVPSRIYLNLGDINELGEIPFQQLTGVTWCEDRVDDTDIEYVRAPAQAAEPVAIPAGWKLVPIEPTVSMVVDGFESWPDPIFSTPEEWGAFENMTGCQQATHKARLCYSAMLAAAPQPPAQADARVGLTDDLRTVLQDAARSLSLRADELRESNTAIDGTWCDADEKAAYDAEVRLIERLRALLAAHPGQSEPRRSENPTGIGFDTPPEELERILAQGETRAEVTDEQIADMFERVTGYSIENGRAALNDADILGFARELLDAARAGDAS
ncbi:Lar family restriction alleviation protein [Burkholderia multivorans]|uniref:Lar family restriction alleviation protein n=1 Tax=Burkholderia multivorans TaxID=87883 RepID=UPI0009E0C5EF|nr:Lar family restriction alleviation protein [Burkholderia multivorans]MDN8078328.1 Lar family restriction alleviation protein [Burkholderia multivorans]SAJ91487.1 hypothetical protein UA11_04716 [Burkholderia multivorans]